MSNTRHSAVVLGCGHRGLAHARGCLAYPDRFELRAVCDLDSTRAATAAEACGGVRQYADAEAMLAAERPEVFCFATQPALRLPLVEMGIRYGVKAIAYEKPMALSVAEAQQINALCAAAGVKTVVCHQHKYGGHWQAVKRLIDEGALGEIREAHATSKGWFYYYITHLVDYTLWLVGASKANWVVGHMHGRGKLSDTHPSPEYIVGRAELDNGVRALFECGPDAPTRGVDYFWYDAGVTVVGTEGIAQVTVGGGWGATTRAHGYQCDTSVTFQEEADTYPYMRDLADWLDDEAAVHPCHGQVALAGFEIAMGMLQAALEHRPIHPPLDPAVPITERMLAELPALPAEEVTR